MKEIVILNASKQPYISIGTHFGGVIIQGVEYIYQPAKDAYIRKDWVKKTKGRTWEQFLELVKESAE
jgi:hypothetical protein